MKKEVKTTKTDSRSGKSGFFIRIFILLIFVSQALAAENRIAIKQEVYNIVSRDHDADSFYFTSAGKIGIGAKKQEGSKEVKAGVDLSLVPLLVSYPGQDPSYLTNLSLDKAYVKTRFDRIQLTMGKTRIGWGEGVVFNSGDVIFGSSDPFIDMTAEEVRTDTGWLTALNIPIGRFSFIEALVMPPSVLVDPVNPIAGYQLQKWDNSSAGGRFYAGLGQFKMEGGYFYRGEEGERGTHNPYLSLHGYFLLDWYAAATLNIPHPGTDSDDKLAWGEWEDYEKSLSISAGAFYQFELGYGNNATFRLESLILPYQEWEISSDSNGDEIKYASLAAEGRSYALMLYPDFSVSFPGGQFVNIKSMVSPIDQSAQSSIGGGWYIYQGLYLFSYFSVNTGEDDDIFSWERDGSAFLSSEGMSLMTGLRFTY